MRDPQQDLAVVNQNSNTLGIFINNGPGAFRAQITYPTGNFPYAVKAGDFNGDGTQDLGVTNFYDATLSVFVGTGSGTFQSQITFLTNAGPALSRLGTSTATESKISSWVIITPELLENF